MIHSFSCKNFYSFSDLNIVNFVVNDKAPDNNGYFVSPSSNRLSKIETVIGTNASGKTNLLKVLPFLKWFISKAYDSNPLASLPVKPFMFGNKKSKPIELSVDFEIKGNIYIYSFILSEKQILFEELKLKNKVNKKTTTKKIFSREWNEKDGKYDFEDKSLNLPKDFKNSLRNNASVVSSAIRLNPNHEEIKIILDFWEKLETNVVEAGWIGDSLLPNSKQHLLEVLSFYSEINNKKIKKEAEKLLSNFDLGLDSFDVKKEKKEDGFSIDVKVGHSFNGETEYLPMQYQSSGTQQLMILLKTILTVLDVGGVAVLDELDVNLHPEISSALLDLFLQPETNPNNAQIIFSTHSHRVLSRLDKYQIILTEKNDKGESEAWRLDDVSGVRADDNYYTKYIAGAYGGIPKI